MSSKANRVYSTDQGRICPQCDQPQSHCQCAALKKALVPNTDGVVRISREKKGRKGKCVTLVTGIPLPEAELKSLAKELRNLCGTGGTVKNHIIELQGDHFVLLQKELTKYGWKVKKSGG